MLGVLAALTAGCIADIGKQTNIVVDHTGDEQSLRAERQLTCGDSVVLAFEVARLEGNLTIRVLDARRAVVFDESFGAGEFDAASTGSDERSLFGEPGDWVMEATWTATDIALDARLTC